MTFDSVDFPVAPNFPNADGSIPAHADAQGKLTRWTLDVDTGAIANRRWMWLLNFRALMIDLQPLAIAMVTLQPLHKGQRVTVVCSTRLPISIAIRVMSALGTRVLETVFLNPSLLENAGSKEGEGWLRRLYDSWPARLPW